MPKVSKVFSFSYLKKGEQKEIEIIQFSTNALRIETKYTDTGKSRVIYLSEESAKVVFMVLNHLYEGEPLPQINPLDTLLKRFRKRDDQS